MIVLGERWDCTFLVRLGLRLRLSEMSRQRYLFHACSARLQGVMFGFDVEEVQGKVNCAVMKLVSAGLLIDAGKVLPGGDGIESLKDRRICRRIRRG
jgi:hypothetical protein